MQIAYSCGLDPRGRGAAVQTLLERCEIKPHLLWQKKKKKTTTSTGAERAMASANPQVINSIYVIYAALIFFFSEFNRAYCMKTV